MTTSPSGMFAMMMAIFEKLDWRFGRGVWMQCIVLEDGCKTKLFVPILHSRLHGGKRLEKNPLYALTGRYCSKSSILKIGYRCYLQDLANISSPSITADEYKFSTTSIAREDIV